MTARATGATPALRAQGQLMSRRQLKKMKRACGIWNAAHPVGTPVSVHNLRHGFCGPITKTFCAAWVCDGDAVIMVEGFGLPLSLELIKPRGLSAAEDASSEGVNS